MARPSYPRHSGPRPAALPPVSRTVGQVVAESIDLYRSRFGACVALGLPVAVVDQLIVDRPVDERIAVLVVAAPFFSLAYAAACAIRQGERPPLRQGERPPLRRWLVAVAAGTLTFLPAAALFPWFALGAILYLGLAAHAVPAAMAEGTTLVGSLRRTIQLGRADYVHAAGSLATLALLFGLTRLALGLLLRSQADNTLRVSIFLADLVIAPVLFLGGAVLYLGLSARVGTTREDRRRLRAEALETRPQPGRRAE